MIISVGISFGQCIGTCTAVTASLTDGSGQVWSNAIITVNIVSPFGNPSPLLNNGVPIASPINTIMTDISGNLSISLDDNNVLTPAGSKWKFTICPNATITNCSQTTLIITGASMSLTASLSSVLNTPVVNTLPTIYRAYNNNEALGGQGSLYWNTISNTLFGCVTAPCPLNWQAIGTGGGGGLPTGLQGTVIVNNNGAIGYQSIPSEYHSAGFVNPTLQSMLNQCPPPQGNGPGAAGTPCVIDLDPAINPMVVATGSHSGTVNVQDGPINGCSAHCVTWISGMTFTNWTANTINIAGAVATVQSVQSATTLTLTTSIGTLSGVNFDAPVTIGSGTQSVSVENRGVSLTCTQNTGGYPCISIAQWGNLWCSVPGKAASPTSGCTIHGSATTAYTSLVSSAEYDGLQSQMFFSGHSMNASDTAVITRGILDVVSVEGKGLFTGVQIQGIANTADVSLEDSPAGFSGDNNDVTFINLIANCSGRSNCIPINIVSGAGTGAGSNYTFIGANIGDTGTIDGSSNPCTAGPGGGCDVNIDGSAAWNGTTFVTGSVVHSIALVHFNNIYIEGCVVGGACTTANVSYFDLKNVRALEIGTVMFSVGPIVDNCVYISHSGAGSTGSIHYRGRNFSTRCTNITNNIITGYTSGNTNPDFEYGYPGDAAGVGGPVIDGGFTVRGNITANNVTDSALISGNCVQAGIAGILTTIASPCGAGGGGFANPMTTLGDMIIENAVPAAARIAGPTGVNGVTQVLTSTPSGGLATLPAWAPPGVVPNAQVGASYTFLASDRAGYVTFNNAGAVTVTLPQASTTGFANNYVTLACDIGAGTVTITPTVSTMSYTTGASYITGALPLTTGQCAWIYSDNTNYFALVRGGNAGALSVQPSVWLSGDGTPFSLSTTLGVFTTGTANQLKCLLSRIPFSLTINNLSFRFNTAGPAASHVSIGMYTGAGTKVWSWDNIDAVTGVPITKSNTIATVNIQPGIYWMCTSGDYNGTSPQASSEGGYAIPSSSYLPYNGPFGTRVGTAANPLSGGVMPATLGVITANGFGQFVGFAMEP
jgi:hypothetical protein